MMNIISLRQGIESIDEIKVIGKSFEFEDVKYHFMGLVRSGNAVTAVFLAYDEQLRDKREQEEERLLGNYDLDEVQSLTVREEERVDINTAEHYMSVRKILSGETEYSIGSAEGWSPSHQPVYEYAPMFFEFIKSGWKADDMEYVSFDYLHIMKCTLMQEYDAIPDFDLNNIRLEVFPEIKRTLTEIPLTLEIGAEPFEIQLEDGETIYFDSVSLVDMREEMSKTFDSDRMKAMLPAEKIAEMKGNFEKEFSKECPAGKYYISAEYECKKETSVRVYLKDVLENPRRIKNSSMAFIMKSDREPKREGLFIKTAIIDEPFDKETKKVEAEIFSVQKTPEKTIIIL